MVGALTWLKEHPTFTVPSPVELPQEGQTTKSDVPDWILEARQRRLAEEKRAAEEEHQRKLLKERKR